MEESELRSVLRKYMRERYHNTSDLMDAKGRIILLANQIEESLRKEKNEYFAWEDPEGY